MFKTHYLRWLWHAFEVPKVISIRKLGSFQTQERVRFLQGFFETTYIAPSS